MLQAKARFKEINFAEIYPEGYDSLGSKFIDNLLQLNEIPFYVIPKGQAYRVDLISLTLYGRYELDWILYYVNGATNIEWFNVGRILSYPTQVDIETVFQRVANTQ